MMRNRILCTLVLIASVAAFGLFNWNYYKKKDTLGPVINMDSSDIVVSVNDPQSQVMAGVTATDSKDGDVTALMLIENLSEFVEENTRIVSYAAFDKDNHVSKAQRRMTYSDYVPPHFSLSAPMRFPVTSGSVNYLKNISAWDCLDGDISGQITFTAGSVINTDTASDYKVILEVTNSAGDTVQLPVTITVYDSMLANAAPTIELSDYLIYTGIGQKLEPLDYITRVIYHNTEYELTDEEGTFAVNTEDWSNWAKKEFAEREPAVNRERFQINDMVNYQVPGTYEIIYELTDLEGNTGRVILTVVVEEQ